MENISMKMRFSHTKIKIQIKETITSISRINNLFSFIFYILPFVTGEETLANESDMFFNHFPR